MHGLLVQGSQKQDKQNNVIKSDKGGYRCQAEELTVSHVERTDRKRVSFFG